MNANARKEDLFAKSDRQNHPNIVSENEKTETQEEVVSKFLFGDEAISDDGAETRQNVLPRLDPRKDHAEMF